MIVEASPADRLPGLARDRPTGELAIANLPKYVCPVCLETTVFEIGESRFDADERQMFDAATGKSTSWETVHSDFHCRICHTPVRVVCRVHEFAMSSYRYLPLAVYEQRNPLLPDCS